MLERELKLHVPPDSRPALEQELKQAQAVEVVLHARYFDTPQRELANARIALRLRLEANQWVQTIKTPGPDELSRIEINHDRTGPTLDLSLYRGTPVETVLATLQGPLLLRYETKIRRLVRRHDTGSGVIELAYDRGTINAGTMELDVCEFELEQISGKNHALFMLGQQWLQRHELIIDFRSKAERGDALATLARKAQQASDSASQITPMAPDRARLFKAPRPEKISLHNARTVHDAYRECAADCVNQIIRNASFLAGVEGANSSAAQVEYVHQLRVGIRRLRSCWAFFKPWIKLDANVPVAELRAGFSSLGQSRDTDIVRMAVTPRLIQAGMPDIHWPENADVPRAQASMLAAGTHFQTVLLKLLDRVVVTDNDVAASHALADKPRKKNDRLSIMPAKPELTTRRALKSALAFRLNKWLKRIVKEGAVFEQLSIQAQHDLRKKIKSLRYALEFSAGVLGGKRPERLRAALMHTQEVLGELNDLYVAQEHYKALVVEQPHAWFALGWLSARQQQKQAEAQTTFMRLSEVPLLKKKKMKACT